MSQTYAVWLVLLGGFCAANLPFVSQRLLLVVALSRPKPFSWRLGELLVFYLLTGAIALAFEYHSGQIAPQGWEFYAITVTLFLTFAFPGFVYRYLLKHPK